MGFLLLLVIMVQATFASSGNIAAQAKKAFERGRYGAAYGQYELALREARKEADLVAEGRILTSMAMLMTHAMEYEEAKKIFERVRVNALDTKGKEDFYRAYMEFYNLQGEYRKAFEIANKHSFRKPSAAFLGEAAIAAAGSGNNSEADSYLKGIRKCRSPGQLAFYEAKVADLKGKDPVKRYESALKHSVKRNQYFTSGIILLRLAEITGNKDYAARSMDVFEELGLKKPFQRAEELK
jgi:tetratricopeptide (TPR) repeat protein